MVQVHKDRDLELVGWFTTLPRSGPIPAIVPIHKQIQHQFNESAILLGFHLGEVDEAMSGSKLPITLYESNYDLGEDGDEAARAEDEDKVMSDAEPQLKPMFREILYAVETLEAEMIGLDHIATGATNAMLEQDYDERSTTVAGKGQGKAKATAKATVGGGKEDEDQEGLVLSAEDEELLAALRTKSNAIKMLQARIQLLVAYLESLQPSYLTTPDAPLWLNTTSKQDAVDISLRSSQSSYPILLAIQALVSRLALLDPSATSPAAADLDREILEETNDARLIELLGLVIERAGDIQDLGARFGVVEASKSSATAAASSSAITGSAGGAGTAGGGGGSGSGLRRGPIQESFSSRSAAGDLLV